MKKKTPDFVRMEKVTIRGRLVCRYYGFWGKKQIRIARRQFYAWLEKPDPRLLLRKQGGKSKGGHAKIPGAGHCWPMKSDALACHPKQRERMEERNRKRGCSVTYEPHAGIAIIPSEGEFQKLMKIESEAMRKTVHRKNTYTN